MWRVVCISSKIYSNRWMHLSGYFSLRCNPMSKVNGCGPQTPSSIDAWSLASSGHGGRCWERRWGVMRPQRPFQQSSASDRTYSTEKLLQKDRERERGGRKRNKMIEWFALIFPTGMRCGIVCAYRAYHTGINQGRGFLPSLYADRETQRNFY